MIRQIEKLSSYQKASLINQVKTYVSGWSDNSKDEIECWIEGNLIFANDPDELPEDNPVEFAGWKCCNCGSLIADYLDYTGRYIECDRCPKCKAHYDFSEDELSNL